jgi:hypothetical protein
VLWTFYLWQPRLIVDVFDGLSRSSVIGAPRGPGIDPRAFLRGLAATLPRARRVGGSGASRGRAALGLAAAAAVATLAVWPPTAVWPVDRLVAESDLYWWRVVPAYFWGVWLPLVFVNVYMLVWIVLRQAIMIANIQRLLRQFAVEPIPFHPDQTSGFAPIGAYAVNIVRVALIVGLWALVLLFSGPATGHGLYVAPHTLFLVVVQVLLTPVPAAGPGLVRPPRDGRGAGPGPGADRGPHPLRPGGRPERAWSAAGADGRVRADGAGYHTWPFRRGALGRASA